MYKNLDELLPNDIKTIAEKRSKDFDVLERSFDIVKAFILKKNRIIYGGMSIDMSLKTTGHKGIYAEDAIPDYDFMSPEMYEDSIELADLLFKAFPDANISAINALHPTSRRVRINFTPVADITYVPPKLYETLPTLMFNKFRIIDPSFQRLDLHRAFINPFEHAPREVAFFRTNKDIKRFKLIDTVFPIAKPKIKLGPTRTIQIPKDNLQSGLLGGTLAMALALGKGEFFEIASSSEGLSITYCDGFPFDIVNIQTDDIFTVLNKINKSGVKPSSNFKMTYYNRFLEDIIPRRILLDLPGKSNERIKYDLYDTKGRLVPYEDLTPTSHPVLDTVGAVKITSMHNILLGFLGNYFIKQDQIYLYMYCYLLDHIRKHPIEMSDHLYGFYNWSYPYLINAQRQYAQLDGTRIIGVRPPHGYYPDKKDAALTFDPSGSWIFQMGGETVDKFEDINLIDTPSLSLIQT